ncbi:MAG: beta galactosidase jelly roll domain-containing protein [Candidatus Bathyarchaeota archaeon]|nr:beta galactosidase jelly roll domain-containing protein [Candidatus Bathyarchaeota archaeon]
MKSWFRLKIPLDGFWKFRVDKDLVGDRDGWFYGFDSTDLIYVPSSWNEQNPDWDQFSGVAWYQKDFHVGREFDGKIAWVVFEGAGYRVKAWVNGSLLGEHEGSFTKFKYRFDGLKIGALNRIVVRIDNSPSIGNLPPSVSFNVSAFDFFHYGGIHRPVYLEFANRCYIDDVTVYTDDRGYLKALIDIVSDRSLDLKISLASKDLSMVVHEEVVTGVRSGRFTYEKVFDGVKPWSPDEPNLYNLILELRSGSGIEDSVYERIGFRSVSIRDGRIYLNGKPIFLKGFGRHEDFPIFGKTLPGPVLVRDFYLMKKIGANSFRTSHYPYSNEHLDMADEFGFLVILEPPLCYSALDRIIGRDEVAKLFGSDEYLAKAKNVISEMVREHKNRPSVIMYSITNEPPSDIPEVADFIGKLSTYFKEVDPSRLLTFTSHRTVRDLALSYVDVISLNFYRGWYSHWGDIGAGVDAMLVELEDIHKRYPGKPIIITEFGADAIVGLHSDPPQMWSEEYQAEFIRRYIESLSAKDYVVGLHVWVFADFRTPQNPMRSVLNRKGVFTRDRQPKISVPVISSLFSKLRLA